jgi:hypothetical protein
VPERTPQFPHGVSSGCVQLRDVITHSDHWQLPPQACLPLPASVEQSCVDSGVHAPTGSTHARRPVLLSQVPERAPQLPHGVSSGSRHSKRVIVHASGQAQRSVQTREPLPASVLHGCDVPGMHAPPPRHNSS